MNKIDMKNIVQNQRGADASKTEDDTNAHEVSSAEDKNLAALAFKSTEDDILKKGNYSPIEKLMLAEGIYLSEKENKVKFVKADNCSEDICLIESSTEAAKMLQNVVQNYISREKIMFAEGMYFTKNATCSGSIVLAKESAYCAEETIFTGDKILTEDESYEFKEESAKSTVGDIYTAATYNIKLTNQTSSSIETLSEQINYTEDSIQLTSKAIDFSKWPETFTTGIRCSAENYCAKKDIIYAEGMYFMQKKNNANNLKLCEEVANFTEDIILTQGISLMNDITFDNNNELPVVRACSSENLSLAAELDYTENENVYYCMELTEDDEEKMYFTEETFFINDIELTEPSDDINNSLRNYFRNEETSSLGSSEEKLYSKEGILLTDESSTLAAVSNLLIESSNLNNSIKYAIEKYNLKADVNLAEAIYFTKKAKHSVSSKEELAFSAEKYFKVVATSNSDESNNSKEEKTFTEQFHFSENAAFTHKIKIAEKIANYAEEVMLSDVKNSIEELNENGFKLAEGLTFLAQESLMEVANSTKEIICAEAKNSIEDLIEKECYLTECLNFTVNHKNSTEDACVIEEIIRTEAEDATYINCMNLSEKSSSSTADTFYTATKYSLEDISIDNYMESNDEEIITTQCINFEEFIKSAIKFTLTNGFQLNEESSTDDIIISREKKYFNEDADSAEVTIIKEVEEENCVEESILTSMETISQQCMVVASMNGNISEIASIIPYDFDKLMTASVLCISKNAIKNHLCLCNKLNEVMIKLMVNGPKICIQPSQFGFENYAPAFKHFLLHNTCFRQQNDAAHAIISNYKNELQIAQSQCVPYFSCARKSMNQLGAVSPNMELSSYHLQNESPCKLSLSTDISTAASRNRFLDKYNVSESALPSEVSYQANNDALFAVNLCKSETVVTETKDGIQLKIHLSHCNRAKFEKAFENLKIYESKMEITETDNGFYIVNKILGTEINFETEIAASEAMKKFLAKSAKFNQNKTEHN